LMIRLLMMSMRRVSACRRERSDSRCIEHRACVTIDRRRADVNLCSLVHTQDCFERLLVTGTGAAALERKDPFSGETPLIAQVQLGEHENAERLLQAGADANAAAAGTPPPLSCQAVVRARTC
jgi:acetoin utilization deacetylase AcuC-like enzyme